MKTRWNPSLRSVSLTSLAAVAVFAGMSGPTLAQGQAAPPVTFTKDIAPILQRSCQNCHRPNGVAPMALTTYEEARPWAKAIKTKTALREMPPWFIERNIGIQKFNDDPSLSDAEVAAIATWVDQGVPRGNPADMPPALQFADSGSWTIGTPDLIVSSPVMTIKAKGGDWHGPLKDSSPTGLPENRWIKAVEVHEVRLNEQKIERAEGQVAGDLNYFAIHHASVSLETEEGGGVGASEPGQFDYLWEVGQNGQTYPSELGVLLPKDARISFPNMHLHPVGKDVQVRLDVAFVLHPKGYVPKYNKVGPRGRVGLYMRMDDIDIPGGDANVRDDMFTTLTQPAKLWTFEPHLHATGKRMCLEAIYPDGYREMLNCAGYNHNWARSYVYADDSAPLLPKGTQLHITAWWDNSANNPRNPEPRNWKGFGHRSVDDMFIFMGKFIPLTEEEFKAEVSAREAKLQRSKTTARNNGN